ncbi:MAG: PilZ domain-containing protein [Bellilinea sp.]
MTAWKEGQSMLIEYTDAMQAVKSLAFQSIPLAVTSTYKGIFLEEKVAPLKVNPDSVTFRAPRKQICATMRTPVILHSKVLPESVSAQVLYINPKAGEVCLSNFSFTGFYWRDRYEQRIEPDAPVYARLSVQQKHYRANLVNLSIHGAGLMIHLGDSMARELTPKTRVDVSFKLSPQNEFNISGVIASIKFLGYCLAQTGLRLEPTTSQQIWLGNYISRRKIEILNELDHQVVGSYASL